MFQGYEASSEEEWQTVAVIFRLSCNVLTAHSLAEGQGASTHSLISGVRVPTSAHLSLLLVCHQGREGLQDNGLYAGCHTAGERLGGHMERSHDNSPERRASRSPEPIPVQLALRRCEINQMYVSADV